MDKKSNNPIHSLREWAPIDVFDKIPSKLQLGILYKDLDITCFDLIEEYIALGTNFGLVFWYNRSTGDVERFKCEISSPITCVRVVSSVEYMIACGCENGQINIFQIQKKIPSELNLVGPLTKPKPIQRYAVRDLHKTSIRCCEWSKNAIKLYSGDKHGIVVLTEFDYHTHRSKSIEIVNESYDIVQLSVHKSCLLISTIYRTVICQYQNSRWKIIQLGASDRKMLGHFGAIFYNLPNLNLTKILASQPSQELWLCDINGNVEKTLQYENSNEELIWNIPILNPSRKMLNKKLYNLNSIRLYEENFIITYNETSVYILNINEQKKEGVIRGFRNILDIQILNKEIFVLEGSRSVIRVAPVPETQNRKVTVIFSPLYPPPIPLISTFETPIEYEAIDTAIVNAQECFEQLPIDIDLNVEILKPAENDNKIEHLEALNKISNLEFDESILYKTEKKFKSIKNKSKK